MTFLTKKCYTSNTSIISILGTPRLMSRQGSKLPDALAVSSQLMWTHNDPHEFITALAAIWGQFVANDIR